MICNKTVDNVKLTTHHHLLHVHQPHTAASILLHLFCQTLIIGKKYICTVILNNRTFRGDKPSTMLPLGH